MSLVSTGNTTKPTITVAQAVRPFIEWSLVLSKTQAQSSDLLLDCLDKGIDTGVTLTTVGEAKYKWRVAKGAEEEAFIGMFADINPGTVRYWSRNILSEYLSSITTPGAANQKHNATAYRDTDDHWVWILWDDLGHITLYEAKRQDTAKSFYWPYDTSLYLLRTRIPKRGVQLPLGCRCQVIINGTKVRYVRLDINGTEMVQDNDIIG